MAQRTAIEWTDVTWNPTTGCTPVSEGCDNCYAEALSHRLLKNAYSRALPVVDTVANRQNPFAVRIWRDRLSQPARWRERRLVFVNSMSDLFHVDVPESFVRSVFNVMVDVDRHTYQVLTKRPARAARFVRGARDLFGDAGLPEHIWIGASTENQETVYRARHLRHVPAAVRFLSCEPLLGPLSIGAELSTGDIHWVIAGGESGPKHRPMDDSWATDLRDECVMFGVPFFFKQWGGRTPKSGGRELEGREWNEMPQMGCGSGHVRAPNGATEAGRWQ
ncbi:MAG: phage Gp37/Gp68 family protein [Gemmatimonadetes bacterium]|nr:phage Gp37/Gp68 family protein [Gemmatimonadota bacterium]MYG22564.1 phage Gp37/Gp68 family protein [Gemmatimonadota bacterium]MYJ38903.1 phage Gp37/Gp68 family protein [Gemmatimonadota bacterium]